MGIKEILEKLREKKIKYKEYQQDMDIARKYEERQMSANERELRRFMKEEREDSIQKELEEFRKKRQRQVQYGNQILKTKNMFDPRINKKSLLKEKNLFVKKGNLFTRSQI